MRHLANIALKSDACQTRILKRQSYLSGARSKNSPGAPHALPATVECPILSHLLRYPVYAEDEVNLPSQAARPRCMSRCYHTRQTHVRTGALRFPP